MVNLIECLSIATEGNGNGSTDVSLEALTAGQCFSSWLIKTHTTFHNSETLQLPWYFGLLCFSYAFGGMMMLVTKPRWSEQSKFPYIKMAWLLILVQAPLSFAADFLSMTSITYIHTVDRLLACPIMAFELGKIATMFPHVRSVTFIAYLSSAVFALYSFCKSSQAQDRVDADAFVFWHNCWHFYPLLVSAIMSFDYFVLGEYDRQSALHDTTSESFKGRRPLSSVIMEKAESVDKKKKTAAASLMTPLPRSTRLRLRANAVMASSP